MIQVKSFKNKSGKEISYIAIPGEKYETKIGFKKCRAVLDHAEEIEMLLKQVTQN